MYQETRLDNGLLIVSEVMPAVETASVGVYVRTGARAEDARNNGVSHFLEHMAFKGTHRRDALAIAAEIEDVGGHMNAATGREMTTYYIKVLKDDLPLAVDMLGDILLNSTFPEEEITRERDVILQEIGEMKDTPDDVVFEHLQEVCYPSQAIGRSILGTVDTVKALRKSDLQTYMGTHYSASNMIVSAAGNVDHVKLVEMVARHFGKLPKGEVTRMAPARYAGGVHTEHRPLEQVHVALAYEGVSYLDPDYYAAHVWTMLMGGGMASPLFQEVREKRGLAYSVFSYLSNSYDTGLFGVYAGTAPERLSEMLPVLRETLLTGTKDLTDESVARARAQLKSSLMMSMESTDSRMGRIARDQMLYGRHVPVTEVLKKLDSLSKADLLRAAGRMLGGTPSLSVVGPADEKTVRDFAA
ncbi:MAG: insulinase family protein [Proteobacteria bacterium]|nr:insulinase family protein [Pseudomonadota bacterium]